MLSVLVENFEKNFIDKNDNKTIARYLDEELLSLSNAEHLQKMVIGKPTFAWDFDSLYSGFIDLTEPFMKAPAQISHLYLHTLRELDCYKIEYIRAIVLLEYFYYSVLIDDYFNFHPEFTKHDPNFTHASRLTQLKYAGKYLSNYPRYLLIQNVFKADDETLCALHKWLSDLFIAWGIGSGVFIKWSHSCFKKMTSLDHYFQNSINILTIYILSPIILAAILAKTSPDIIMSLKKAFSYLTLFTKIRVEKRILTGQLDPRVDPNFESSLIPILFQGFGFLKKDLQIDQKMFSNVRFPDVRTLTKEIYENVMKNCDPKTIDDLEKLEKRYFLLFLTEIERADLCRKITGTFRTSFNM
jgi:hypothetical protein